MNVVEVDLSRIGSSLSAYPREVRQQAVSAILKLSKRVRKMMVRVSQDTSFLNQECEGIFCITYEAFSDRFEVHDIEIADAPLVNQPGAFVVRRNDFIRAVKIRSRGVKPYDVSSSLLCQSAPSDVELSEIVFVFRACETEDAECILVFANALIELILFASENFSTICCATDELDNVLLRNRLISTFLMANTLPTASISEEIIISCLIPTDFKYQDHSERADMISNESSIYASSFGTHRNNGRRSDTVVFISGSHSFAGQLSNPV